MMKNNSKFWQYFKAYKVSNIAAMVKNNRLDPLVCHDDFTGRLVMISGATSGIGYFAARKYASKGARLLFINRSKEKSERLKKELQDEFGVEVEYLLADLSSLQDLHRVGDELSKIEGPIEVLIHNAGVYLTKRELTNDGLEKVFVVQYLASFILNYLLSEKLKAQERARIVLVNSEGHRFAPWGIRLDDMNWERRRYSGLKSYGSAKMAQLLSMIIFKERFEGSGVSIIAMHPGAVKTETGQENGKTYRWFKRKILDKALKSANISSESLYYLGVSKDIEAVSGKFFNLTKIEEPAPPALDREEAVKLWELSLVYGKLDRGANFGAKNR